MMEKRTNKYNLTLTQVSLAKGEVIDPQRVDLVIENHDELFEIIDRLKDKDPFQNAAQATEFAIGLKLFSEVMIKNRTNPLFSEFFPEFGTFMKKLKGL